MKSVSEAVSILAFLLFICAGPAGSDSETGDHALILGGGGPVEKLGNLE